MYKVVIYNSIGTINIFLKTYKLEKCSSLKINTHIKPNNLKT